MQFENKCIHYSTCQVRSLIVVQLNPERNNAKNVYVTHFCKPMCKMSLYKYKQPTSKYDEQEHFTTMIVKALS